MGEATQRDVTNRPAEDPAAGDRAARLTELLATGIERYLRRRVDSGRDVAVYPDVETDRRQW